MCDHGVVEIPGINPSKCYHGDDTEQYHIEEVLPPQDEDECEQCDELVELLNHGYSSDLKWSMKDYRPPRYQYLRYRVPSEIRDEVLKSNRVKRVLSILHKDTGRSMESLDEEARSILEEMGHQFSLTILRLLGGLMRKLIKEIVTSITVNGDNIIALKRLSSDSPLLLIPTHRSYLDFIIVTWILYSFDIKTPVIAAGQDFMFMKGVGSLLRRCGAYFIRRSFGKDKLYWALFAEYTQTHIINGDAPVEFFIEGTRSRTGKSLQPKFGMLTIALEPYFDARVADVSICPITLCYEKTIEENLHVRELMGIPKPKESTTGLIKARSVLDNNYGRICVKAGNILSVHLLSRGKVDRKRRALVPRSVIPSVHPHERHFVNNLAYQILLEQQRNSVVFPCSVMASILLFYISKNKWSVPHQQLRDDMLWGCDLFTKLGCTIDLDVRYEMMQHSLDMLGPVVRTDDNNVIVERNPSSSEHLTPIFRSCHSLISLGRRRNELMHGVIHASIIAKILETSVTYGHAYHVYSKIYRVLQIEFVFKPNNMEADFESCLSRMVSLHVVSYSPDSLLYSFSDAKTRDLLVSLIEPFLVTYNNAWLFCISYTPRTSEHAQSIKALANRIQTYNSVLYNEPLRFGELLNLNVIENSILVLGTLGLITVDKNTKTVFCKNPNNLSDFCIELSLLLTPLISKL